MHKNKISCSCSAIQKHRNIEMGVPRKRSSNDGDEHCHYKDCHQCADPTYQCYAECSKEFLQVMNSYEEERRFIQQSCILLQTIQTITKTVVTPLYNCFNDKNKTARGVHSEDFLTAQSKSLSLLLCKSFCSLLCCKIYSQSNSVFCRLPCSRQ